LIFVSEAAQKKKDFNLLAELGPGEFSVIHDPYYSPILPSRSFGRRDLQDRYWVVSYEGDDEPVKYYLYDRVAKTTSFLFNERPKLESHKLAKMRPVSYQSRDALTLHGYLTTPVGIAPENLPTVILVHGGPWAARSLGLLRCRAVARKPWIRRAPGELPRLHRLWQEVRPGQLQRVGR
jgi:hypothetical protein